MIKLEHVVLVSPEQMEFIIEGMRNPMNSHDRSDTYIKICRTGFHEDKPCDPNCANPNCSGPYINNEIGPNDLNLMQRLANAGTDHRKFMRMMPVYVRITAGHTFWAEFDTYKIGTVRNSCSKMHKIHVMGFGIDSFDHEGIDDVGGIAVETFDKVRSTLLWLSNMFNKTKEKKYWRAMIELLPMGFHLTANVELNYEVLANIYRSRKNHKLAEWRELCSWIESLPYSELITGAAGSLEARRIFGEPFPWTKEGSERARAKLEATMKDAVDKELLNAIIPDSSPNSFSMKDLEEVMKHYDPNDGVKTHVTMMKED